MKIKIDISMINDNKIEMLIIDHSSVEMPDLMMLRGELFNKWLEFWNRLSNSEKDPYTHPFWIISILKGLSDVPHLFNRKLLYFLYLNGAIISVILLEKKAIFKGIERFYVLRCPMLLLTSSLASNSDYYTAVADAFFRKNSKLKIKQNPLAIIFSRIDSTNQFLNAPVNKLVFKDYKRCILAINNDFLETNSGLKRNFRKWEKRALGIGKLHFSSIENEPEIFKAFEDLMDLEMLGWKGKTPNAMRKNDFTRNFLYSLIGAFSGSGNAVVFLLKLDDVLIAANIAFIIEDTMYTIKTVYNEDYSKLSPGSLIYERVFKEYFPARNLKYANCISTSEWFHDNWHGTYFDTYKMFIFPDSLLGNCIKSGIKVYKSIKDNLIKKPV